MYLYYNEEVESSDETINVVKQKITCLDLEMEYWGEVNRYTRVPFGLGFAIAVKFKKVCYIGRWSDGLLKGWG